MNAQAADAVIIAVDGATRVAGLWLRPAQARCTFVFAHGAGAGMRHAFMAGMASDLAALGIATLRFEFPYMGRRSRRPDPPQICHATVRAAVAEAARLDAQLPLIAGGKSFGGRMTSQAQAATPLSGVRGLAFVGFPLHPAGKPSDARAEHLSHVRIPMLFLQGSRDALAEAGLLEPLVTRLAPRARLHLVPEADHAFHVPARSGQSDFEVRQELAEALAAWAREVVQ